MIQFGKYDRKIQFIQFGTQDDGYGGTLPFESVLLSTLSSVKQMKGSSDLEQAQLELPKTYIFKVQYRSGFVPSEAMQIKYDGFNHKITGVTEETERNAREWLITAVRI